MVGKEWQLSLGFVCVILGFLSAVQFRTQQRLPSSLPDSRVEELTTVLKEAEKKRDSLKKEVKVLRSNLSKYEQAASEGESLIAVMNTELKKMRLIAGLTKVKGEGLIIYLEDSKLKANLAEDTELFLIHEEDLLKVVNELFAAGAEVVSINGQRMIANTEIRCAGPTILVNGTRIASPYEISAIGSARGLESSLNMRGGIVEMLRAVGIKVNLVKSSKVVIPAFSGASHFDYVEPVEGGE